MFATIFSNTRMPFRITSAPRLHTLVTFLMHSKLACLTKFKFLLFDVRLTTDKGYLSKPECELVEMLSICTFSVSVERGFTYWQTHAHHTRPLQLPLRRKSHLRVVTGPTGLLQFPRQACYPLCHRIREIKKSEYKMESGLTRRTRDDKWHNSVERHGDADFSVILHCHSDVCLWCIRAQNVSQIGGKSRS